MGLVEVRRVSQGLFSPCLADYYTPAMLGLKTDQEVLGELVRAKLPAVGALMEQLGVLWTLVVSRWFICLYVDVLPVEVSALLGARGGQASRQGVTRASVSLQTVLRIWDCLFNEGSKIIFRVALTLIKQHQEFILEATSIPDICDKFKQITKGSFVMECHTFMQRHPVLVSEGWCATVYITLRSWVKAGVRQCSVTLCSWVKAGVRQCSVTLCSWVKADVRQCSVTLCSWVKAGVRQCSVTLCSWVKAGVRQCSVTLCSWVKAGV
ncbi:hypothetical protein P7K49_000067 [Saguinus oedipus]|uniref:Rab-GAP TBC domain-containing protein n=1 Tax=Saguinus oedipus TaxID=9490 RepID=A0ABQ9WAN7_SAGOE|nr:hypothetical protein P7K49_000067 [Saguinus oedipus]